MAQLSQSQINQLTDVFNMFDKDGDGHLTLDELRQVFCNEKMTEIQIKHVLQKMDTDGSNTVELDEFLATMSMIYRCLQEAKKLESLRVAFRKFDKNGDNQISPEELKEGLRCYCPSIKPELLDDMVAEYMKCDTNHDNKIDFEEFLKMHAMAMEQQSS